MKKILLALIIVATAGAWFSALSIAKVRARQQLRREEGTCSTLTQQLAAVQTTREALTAEVNRLQVEAGRSGSAVAVAPALADFLLSKNGRMASPDIQDKILAEVKRGGGLSADYALVSKAALRAAAVRPLKSFPDVTRLTDTVRGVLAITPEEQQSVELAFARAFEGLAAWAKANVQREGPSENTLVRYTIPADPAFEKASTEALFSDISAIVGEERGELMRSYFEYFRIYEDGAIGSRTNILEIDRVTGQSTLGYRAGWKWDKSEAMNTDPEPIKPNKFPVAFSFVFPGGWPEVAQREGLELPEAFTHKP